MTKRTIDLDQVRVVQADNYKGNPRVYLEVADARVLYTSPQELAADEGMAHYVDGDGEVRTDLLADLFRHMLARMLAEGLQARYPDQLAAWGTSTDREVDYVKPRLEEDRDA